MSARKKRKPLVGKNGEPIEHKRYYGNCPRCGVESKGRRNPTCLDCDGLLNEKEREEWYP